ncbi:phage holin family protein, partial [Vibrio diabolicus]
MKDPGLWAVILGWLAEHQPVIYGVVLSMGTAALRVVY